jgi:hypothetical protein
MRPLRFPCVLVLACVFPARVCADDFSEFRIPDHFGGSWSATINGSASSYSQNLEARATRERQLDGGLFGACNHFHDSDRHQWNLQIAGGLAGRRQTFHVDEFFEFPGPPPGYSALRREETQRLANENLRVAGSSRAYPWSIPLGWDVRGQAQLTESQNWDDRLEFDTFHSFSDSRIERSGQTVIWRYQEEANLGVTLGAGRVRDASPVFQAILLEERLRRDGALARALSPAARQRVADLYALRGSFGVPHDLPEKFFWRELERALRDEGAIADSGFDAYALHHADEALVVAGFGFFRPVGWFVGPTLSFSHLHALIRREDETRSVFLDDGIPTGAISNHFGSRSKYFVDRTFYGATGEFHRPLGRRTQLSLSENATIDLRPDPDGLEVRGYAVVQRLVAERWFGQVQVFHRRTLLGDPDLSSWEAQAAGSIDYYLEDFVRASLTFAQDWSGMAFGIDRRRNVDFDASVALTFGRGRLDAPGLIGPERALK